MSDNNVETSEVSQDSLEGAPAVPSDAGSAPEDVERATPKSAEVEDGNTRDTAEEESAEAEEQAQEDETSTQDSESQQNGQHEDKNEADSTGVEGTVSEKRKSISETEEHTPKKIRVEEEEVAADAPVTNGQQEASA